ncbi:MAG: 2-oxoacid:acceptor oxidoreductase subunit alpha [Candidatus Omnitrophica bacterium]|nr:2-oxoacid:acceptor oxidoreductase subunit alpha [Candidatus Omnitrophota bacterium]
MNNFSILIGGKAGFGIDKSGTSIAKIINRLCYRIYVYRDYPSLIRGGHTFSIIRANKERISSGEERLDFILALNQDTINLHKWRLKENSIVIYDSDSVQIDGLAVRNSIRLPISKIIKEENAPEILRNSCMLGAFVKASGISWEILDAVFRKEYAKELDLNLKVARRAFDEAKELIKIPVLEQKLFPILSGNEATGLGLIKAGLKNYVSYPMTPTSPILHFLADEAKDFGLKVIHPESEIGVILMALGFSYIGEKTAVGTSGGGFCLMTEGLSFSGMAELPVVIIVGQRPGPSTGLPTYSTQTELHFVLSAGQGEFLRFVVAPGDAEEAYFWSAVALNTCFKFQIPSFILTDKNLGEGLFNFDIDCIGEITDENPSVWDRSSIYKRYLDTETGISPLAFPPEKDQVIKVNSYEHDEAGITTEEAVLSIKMQDKRLRKEKYLLEELEKYRPVNVYGNSLSETAILCWGSNKGVCVEIAEKLNLKVIQPLVLSPFPLKQFSEAVSGVKRLICVENNATGQLVKLIKMYGFNVDGKILKYDGRPFSLEELEMALKKEIK